MLASATGLRQVPKPVVHVILEAGTCRELTAVLFVLSGTEPEGSRS